MVVGLIIIGVVVVGFVAFIVTGAFGKTGSKMQRLAVATRVPIADLVDGERVKIEGHIAEVTASPLTSRVSGEAAVCTHLELTYHHQGSRYIESRRDVPFRVVDQTGETHVGIKDAVVVFGERTATTRLDGASITGWARQALEADGLTFSGAPAGRLDVTEQILAPGDPVAVMGMASVRPDPENPLLRHVVILPDPDLGVIISGDPVTFDG